MSADKKKFDAFRKLVSDHYDQLTNAEKRITDFILQNQDEVAFMSAAEVAERLEISEPTMLRFAKTLAELKRKIGEAEYAVELQVQNGILPLNSTIDTVTEAEKKEALRQKGLENKRYSYGSEY